MTERDATGGSADTALATGSQVAQYRILRRLGSGGMAVVYLAEDTRLKRPVALKFLPPALVRDDTARARLALEARSASALDHPNICTIYDVAEAADGQLFIAMAYYEGETLKARLGQGLAVDEAIEIAIQTCDGLAKAHRHGIVHRDIKPANLMVTGDGLVKILDFGLAKLIDDAERLTSTGAILGSIAYMSPEQTFDEGVDHRSDIWALGVVLYRTLTGTLPFDGSTEIARIRAIQGADPPPLGEDVPPELGAVVAKALAKEPTERFQSAGQMGRALRALRGDSSSSVTLSSGYGPVYGPPAPRESVAVLPFADMSAEGDQGYLCLGMAEELTSALSRVDGLKVASRTSTARFAGGEDVRAVGRRLGVMTVLEGSVRKSGEQLRITVRLISVVDGFELWSERFDRRIDDIFALQDEIAACVVETLRVTLMGALSKPAARPYSGDVAAYRLYLKGRYAWNQRTRSALEDSVEHFRRALAIDPLYAQAHAGLADAYSLLGVYGAMPPRRAMPAAREAIHQALAIDGSVAAAHTSLGGLEALYNRDFETAERAFLRAIELDPHGADAHHWYAINCLTPTGRFNEAQNEMRLALELEPQSLILNTSLGLVLHYGRRYEEAIAQYRRTHDIDEGYAIAHLFRGRVHLQLGEQEAAVPAIRRAIELAGGSTEMTTALARAYVACDQRDDAERLYNELLADAETGYVSSALIAEVELAFGNIDAALDRLDQAFRQGALELAWLEVRPVYDPLRSEERFIVLSDGVGLGEYAATKASPASRHDRSEIV